MPNDYFQFKQFLVRQQHSALKVTTEACMLGAWFARAQISAESMLDIGAGTGILMLMLAQKHDMPIDGIELDPETAMECRGNLNDSPWSNRLKLIEGDVRSFHPNVKYDFIISNPPFYEHSLKRTDPRINGAMHGTTLSLEDLAYCIDRCMSDTGSCGLILPIDRSVIFENCMRPLDIHTVERILVRHSRSHPAMRVILRMSRNRIEHIVSGEICIQERGDLLSDYYLHG